MDVRMDGRKAIITGGSAGLGKAMAMEFNRSGADVAIVGRRQDALDLAKTEIETAGDGKVVAISADIRLASDCKRVVGEAEAALGNIDILINNAGTSQRGPFMDVSDELWQDDLDLKLFASIRLTRLLFPGMCERQWGRIINVLNVGAKIPSAEGAPTQVTRAAGMALMKVLACEGAPHNVLVNGLLVGKIRSDPVGTPSCRRRARPDVGGMVRGCWSNPTTWSFRPCRRICKYGLLSLLGAGFLYQWSSDQRRWRPLPGGLVAPWQSENVLADVAEDKVW